MGEFVCKVADSSGHVNILTESAGTAAEVRRRLGEKGYFVYSVKARGLRELLEWEVGPRRKRISANDFLLFNQQLLTLVRAGLPILKALELLANRSTHPGLARVLEQVHDNVRSGDSLSEALQKAGTFSPVYTTAVLAGERSGDLVGVLEHYISYQKVTSSVRRRLVTALVYPSILILVSVLVLSGVIGYVIPRFSELYSEMGSQLPPLTQMVITFSLGVREWMLTVGFLIAGGVVAAYLAARNQWGARVLDKVWMEVPLVGSVVRRFRLSQFARTLGTLLQGGIPLVSALETAGGAMESPVLRRAIHTSVQRVREGQSLHRALADTGVFPEMMTEMIEVGETTGALPSMLDSVAEFYDEELNARISMLLALLEPALLLTVGGTVLVILVSLYMPIFSLSSLIR